tara:strand:+ start:275 stop:700 length:426 start_codon:yes stop_codon:yes gene_type:complete
MKANKISLATGIAIGIISGLLVGFILIQVKNRCFVTTDSKDQMDNIIKTLVRQAARWSTAAAQDDSPLVAVLHANYGTGFLWALKDIATTSQIEQVTGIDYMKFEKEIVTVQDNATKKMIKLCPDFAPPKSYLTSLSGEGI